MTPRNLSIAYLSTAPNLSMADTDCITATADAIKTWLNGCIVLGTMVGMAYYNEFAVAHDAYYYEGMWLARAAESFGRVRASIAEPDRTNIQTWLLDQAQYMSTMINTQLESGFCATRSADNYTTLWAGANVARGETVYQGGPMIYTSAVFHNNRRATMVIAIVIVAVLVGSSTLIADVKRYVKEWIRFSVFADGAQGEWERADDYSTPVQGLLYGATNIACALEVAARLKVYGDTELLSYSTTAGANGTEGSARTIYTAVDMFARIMTGEVVLYTYLGNLIDWWKPLPGSTRAYHWQWSLQPLQTLGESRKLSKFLIARSAAADGLGQDHYWPAWTGVCGLYTDSRTGVEPYPTARF